MKYRILPFLCCMLLAVGCGKDEQIEEKLTSEQITLNAGDTWQLQLTNGKKITVGQSTNTFVAKCNNAGLVTAVRRGTAIVRANNYECQVTVNTTINDFEEPLQTWGITLAQLKDQKGTPSSGQISEEYNQSVYFYNLPAGGKIRHYYYVFDNTTNKMVGSAMAVYSEHLELLDRFLAERYMNVTQSNTNTSWPYVDGLTSATTKLVVRRFYTGTTYQNVTYTAYTTN